MSNITESGFPIGKAAQTLRNIMEILPPIFFVAAFLPPFPIGS
jgi:hypothetical protein